MFKRVFIANRGEIALRVIRSCRELGLVSIIGYSEADRDSIPVRDADERICIGPPSPSESYLNVPSLVSAMEIKRAEAVHPGYGFLSENIPFVEICEASRITFIGPSAASIRLMGDKALARKTARAHRVPVVPGAEGVESFREALAFGRRIGFPLMIKASGGGGGRGMRIVHVPAEFESAWNTCREEARAAFDNPVLYIEKYVERPRHIEVQILADGRGTVLLFPERDCSIQRRHQKLIEESPSPLNDGRLRACLLRYARRVADAVQYRSAGTIEFLVDPARRAYFMEMNTRIQVEHPVTEMVTQADLVKSQILIARGDRIRDEQDDISIHGHAVECRINAEDPFRGFIASPGRITRFVAPGGPGIRLDTHIHEGYFVPPYYDSLLGKLIAFGRTREEAVARMRRALDEIVVEGVKTTIPLHRRILRHPLFLSGRYYVGWLEKALENGLLGQKG